MFCQKNTPLKIIFFIAALASFGVCANASVHFAVAEDTIEQLPQIEKIEPSSVQVEKALPSSPVNEPAVEIEQIN